MSRVLRSGTGVPGAVASGAMGGVAGPGCAAGVPGCEAGGAAAGMTGAGAGGGEAGTTGPGAGAIGTAGPAPVARRLGRVLDGEVVDARTEAARILAAAQAQADAVLASAGAVREAARQAGFADGREAGLASVTELLVRARAGEVARIEAAENELRRLAVRIAEKILGRELALGDEAVTSVVRTALAGARTRGELVIRVHPEDEPAIRSRRAELAATIGRPADLTVRADPAVGRGGCRIETAVGTIDARLEVQLAAIERALVGVPGDGGHD